VGKFGYRTRAEEDALSKKKAHDMAKTIARKGNEGGGKNEQVKNKTRPTRRKLLW